MKFFVIMTSVLFFVSPSFARLTMAESQNSRDCSQSSDVPLFSTPDNKEFTKQLVSGEGAPVIQPQSSRQGKGSKTAQ